VSETNGPDLSAVAADPSETVGVGIRVGIDRIELTEFTRIVESGGDHFLETAYTAGELQHCRGRIEKLATRFAAKEATTKVLGTGIRGLSLDEIEVVTSPQGQPSIRLYGRAQLRAQHVRLGEVVVSMTHTSVAAEAFVVGLTHPSTRHPGRDEERLP
jgi:holo-[acyl-carrier protein] synthase